MDGMLMVAVVTERGGEWYVFVVKRFEEREFHLPRKALEHDSLTLVSTGDFLEEVFLQDVNGRVRVYFVPRVIDRGLPVRAAVVRLRKQEDPVCKKEFSSWEWLPVSLAFSGEPYLRLEAASRAVICHVFAADAGEIMSAAANGSVAAELAS